MTHTTDPNDPRLGFGSDDAPRPQQDAYLVLSESIRQRGFVRPVMRSYQHETCGSVTTMSQAIAETYAADPRFYGSTYCATCRMHRPVGQDGEFVWVVWVGTDHLTWEPGGELQPSDDCVTANRLKVGT